jgi:FKBP-type peptidyl-prolyl cis-trans isomerase
MTLVLNDVIRGWTEGVQLMVEGERRLAMHGSPDRA